MKRQADFSLVPDPANVSAARRFTTEHLVDWGLDDIADTAILLVSETVTNIVLHAGTVGTLSLAVEGSVLRVEVRDGSATLPARRRYADDAATGRGLLLVEALADRWGAEPDGTGKIVWFEVELAGAPHEPRGAATAESGGTEAGVAEAVEPMAVLRSTTEPEGWDPARPAPPPPTARSRRPFACAR